VLLSLPIELRFVGDAAESLDERDSDFSLLDEEDPERLKNRRRMLVKGAAVSLCDTSGIDSRPRCKETTYF
jgi:hypothetical protein